MSYTSRRALLQYAGLFLAPLFAGCSKEFAASTGDPDRTATPSSTRTSTDTPTRTARSTDSPTTENTPTDAPTCADPWDAALQWRFVTGEVRAYQPTVADGIVYFASQGDTIYAVDAGTGTQVWHQRGRTPFHHPPTVTNGTVYSAGLRAVEAFEATTGAVQWRFETPGEVENVSTNVVVDGGRVFASASQIPGVNEDVEETYNRLYALNGETGEPEWKLSLPPRSRSELEGVAASDGRVYVLTDDGTLRRVDAGTGQVEWKHAIASGFVETGPLLRNDRIYLTASNRLWVVDAESGEVLWQYRGCNGAPAVTEDRVVCPTDDLLTAIGRAGQGVEWQVELPGGIVASDSGAKAGDGVVYVPIDRENRPGMVASFDVASGCRFGQYEIGERRPTPVVTSPDRIYFGGLHGDGTMYAVAPP